MVNKLTLDVQVRRKPLHRIACKLWPFARHIPILRCITRWLIIRGVLFRVGTMPWRQLYLGHHLDD